MRNSSSLGLGTKTRSEVLAGIDGSYAYWPLHEQVGDGTTAAVVTNITGLPDMVATAEPWNDAQRYAEGDGARYLSTGAHSTIDELMRTDTLGNGGILMSCWIAGDDENVNDGGWAAYTYGASSVSTKGINFRLSFLSGGYKLIGYLSDGVGVNGNHTNPANSWASASFAAHHLGCWISNASGVISAEFYADGLSMGSPTDGAEWDASAQSDMGFTVLCRSNTVSTATQFAPIDKYVSDCLVVRTPNAVSGQVAQLMAELASSRGTLPNRMTIL